MGEPCKTLTAFFWLLAETCKTCEDTDCAIKQELLKREKELKDNV